MIMPLKTIIIDDEVKGRNVLNELITRYCQNVTVLAMAANAGEGIKAIKEHKPDCILLDIQMPQTDGFAMLDQIDDLSCEVIFVTAHNEHAIKAFKYAAFDYLLKPVDSSDLQQAFERLQQKRDRKQSSTRMDLLKKIVLHPHQLPSKLTISSAEGIMVVNIADIVYLMAEGPYTFFYLFNNEKIIASVNLQKYEELLSEQQFFRTHHSYLVNLNHVKKYSKLDNRILLSNGQYAEVSRRKKDEFLQALAAL